MLPSLHRLIHRIEYHGALLLAIFNFELILVWFYHFLVSFGRDFDVINFESMKLIWTLGLSVWLSRGLVLSNSWLSERFLVYFKWCCENGIRRRFNLLHSRLISILTGGGISYARSLRISTLDVLLDAWGIVLKALAVLFARHSTLLPQNKFLTYLFLLV